MGLLERWDKHNQRTLEWHNHLAAEQRTRDPRLKLNLPWAALGVVSIAITLGRRLLARLIGPGPTVAILVGLAILLFVVAYRLRRRSDGSGRRRGTRADRRLHTGAVTTPARGAARTGAR